MGVGRDGNWGRGLDDSDLVVALAVVARPGLAAGGVCLGKTFTGVLRKPGG